MKKIIAILALTAALPAFSTVSTTTSRIEYAGNGSTKVFAFSFPAASSGEIEVYVNGVKLTTGFSVALNANQSVAPGGSVTVTVPPLELVRIQRNTSITQGTSLSAYSQFPAKVIEKTIDAQTRQLQQVDRRVADAETTHETDKATQAVKDAQQDTVTAAQSVTLLSTIAQNEVNLRAELATQPGTAVDTRTVTPTGASASRSLAALFGDVANVLNFGSNVGNCSTYDDAAFTAALATGKEVVAPMPPGGCYKLAAPIAIGTKRLVGLGHHPVFKVYHSGAAFTLAEKGYLENVSTDADTPNRANYTGVLIDAGVSPGAATQGVVRNVLINYPSKGLWLRGGVYWWQFDGITVFKFHDYGVLADNRAGAGLSGPNNNTFNMKAIESDTVGDAWGGVGWEQASFRIYGSVNTFNSGEPAPSKYGVIIDAGSISNAFNGTYGEHQLVSLKAGKGSFTIWNSSSWIQNTEIDDDAKVVGPGGLEISIYNNWMQRTMRGDKALKALYYFNEGSGDTIIDHSGNARHLKHQVGSAPSWTENGRWGKALQFDPQNGKYLDDIPTAAVDWTQPFSVAILSRVEALWGNSPLLVFRDGSAHYSRVMLNSGFIEVQDSAGGKIATSTMIYSPHDGWVWTILYFDPVNKTISSIDPFFGVTDNIVTPNVPAFSPWATGGGGGVSSVSIMRHPSFNQGIKGNVSFLAFWQRKPTWGEVIDLVNMKVPNVLPERATRTVKKLSVLGDGATGEVTYTAGTGTPEGAVTANVGSIFTRLDGGASTTLYVKTSGAGNTGWTAK